MGVPQPLPKTPAVPPPPQPNPPPPPVGGLPVPDAPLMPPPPVPLFFHPMPVIFPPKTNPNAKGSAPAGGEKGKGGKADQVIRLEIVAPKQKGKDKGKDKAKKEKGSDAKSDAKGPTTHVHIHHKHPKG